MAALEQAQAALAAAEWHAARAAFGEALAAQPRAAVYDGLGLALWWLGDIAGAIEARERAYVTYVDEGHSPHPLSSYFESFTSTDLEADSATSTS
jgi:hypothetical protein